MLFHGALTRFFSFSVVCTVLRFRSLEIQLNVHDDRSVGANQVLLSMEKKAVNWFCIFDFVNGIPVFHSFTNASVQARAL